MLFASGTPLFSMRHAGFGIPVRTVVMWVTPLLHSIHGMSSMIGFVLFKISTISETLLSPLLRATSISVG